MVQLYVSDRESEVFRPVRELKGFEKIFLAPGECKTVTFTLEKRSFAYWNTQIHDWYVETGVFDIQICRDAERVVLEAPVTVECTVKIPVVYTEDSIMMDIMKDPKAAAVMKELQDKKEPEEEKSETAGEAITQEMDYAMFGYMPLRARISFDPSKTTHETLAQLLEKLNG